MGYSPWGHRESDTTERLHRHDINGCSIGGSVIENPPDNAGDTGDTGSIPGSGGSPGGGHGNPLQYPCLENPMDKEPGGLQSMGSQRVRHD